MATPEKGEAYGKTEARSVNSCRTGLNCKYGKRIKLDELPKTVLEELLKDAAFKQSVGDKILTDAYTDKEIDALIRAMGGDPDAIDLRSREQARKIWERWRG